MLIPYEELEHETLLKVLDEFVSRDGTDYGIQEVDRSKKVSQVLRALKAKQAVLVFDEESESTTILSMEEYKLSEELTNK